ncbi:unnamed protein product [Durusdinium trenchii]|uniref:Uncharacterized protein n=1 Tax=Durusdinium trenchii TaxID=1381693 RepID=A0ABP0RTR6_9DINO
MRNWEDFVVKADSENELGEVFNDTHMVSDMEQELRFQRWKDVVLDVARTSRVSRGKMMRLVILEIGCGGRVPTVRATCETTASQLKKYADVTVARINPDFPLPDRLHPPAMYSRYLCLPMKGLEGLRKINEQYQELIKPRRRAEQVQARAAEKIQDVKEEPARSRSPKKADVPVANAKAPQMSQELKSPKAKPAPKRTPEAKAKSEGSPKETKARGASRRAPSASRPQSKGVKTLD